MSPQSNVAVNGPARPAPTLVGTPVVPGVVVGPVVLASTTVRLSAIAAFEEKGVTGVDDGLPAYDAAVDQVAAGLEARAGKVTGAAAEVLTATAGLARDKG